jgi:hypothetical protein
VLRDLLLTTSHATVQRSNHMSPTAIPCPVCQAPAQVYDPSLTGDWFAIEGCPCGRYWVRADLVASRRFKNLVHAERRELQERMHAMHARTQQTWVDTETGTVLGPLVVLPEPPR